MGGVQEPVSSNLNLEAIVDSEIFPSQKNIFKKAKQGLEKALFHYKNKIIIPAGTAIAIAGYLWTYKAMEQGVAVAKLFRPDATFNDFPIEYTPVLGIGMGILTLMYLDDKIKECIGKKLIKTPKSNEKKENFFYRHRYAGYSLVATSASVLFFLSKFHAKTSSLPQATRDAIQQNMDKVLYTFTPIAAGLFVGFNLLFNYTQKVGIFKKREKQTIPGQLISKISKKLGIAVLEEQSKKGNLYADMALANVKSDIQDKLEHEKRVIERIKEEKTYYGNVINKLTRHILGANYSRLKKQNIESIISMAMTLYQINPERSIRLFNKLGEAVGEDTKPHIVTTRNIFLNAHGADTTPDWKELRSILEKLGLLKFVEGSEGLYSQFLDNFTGKNIIFKDYKVDKSNKFFLERAILEILKGSRISVENPLFYYDEGNVHKQIFIRDGEKNLREFLAGKSEAEIGECFEKVLPTLFLYQQKVFSALEEKGPKFIMSTEFRGTKRRLKIPVLNLEASLKRRAFHGSKPGELRLGDNEYLEALLKKLNEYSQLNQHATVYTFNRGDTTTANITETLCIIDPRPCIAHPLYDFAYISCDPIFTHLSFGFRKEMALEVSLRKDEFKGMAADFSRAFDSLYINLALSNAGANLHLGKKDLTRIIIKDLLKFSKGKPFDNELRTYLEHSNAS